MFAMSCIRASLLDPGCCLAYSCYTVSSVIIFLLYFGGHPDRMVSRFYIRYRADTTTVQLVQLRFYELYIPQHSMSRLRYMAPGAGGVHGAGERTVVSPYWQVLV